jgi:hypothetical protein
VRLPSTLAFAFLLLAGCVSGGGATSTDPGGPVATGEPIPDAGTIRGVVVDESQAPIAQAQVALAETTLQAVTDEAGGFEFGNLAPGPYVLQAGRIGYESAAKRVDVEPNGEHSVVLALTTLAVVEPYHDTFGPFSGYFECQIGTPTAITPCTGDSVHDQDLNSVVFPGDRRHLHYNMTSDEWQTMVGEARWAKTSVATSQGMATYPSYLKRPTSHWWCEADGPSPIRFVFEKEGESVCNSVSSNANPPPSMKINPLVLVADPGFGGTSTTNPPARLMMQQKFELMMTVFYYEPAPSQYSGFPDA